MKKYILISKDNQNNTFTMYASSDYRFIYHKYRLWKNILPKEFFAIYTRIEQD